MTEKPIGIVLPSWNPDEPRFIVETCKQCSDDRQFKNSKCVFNQRLGFAYSVDEIVEVLNALGDENEQLKQENQGIQEKVMRLLDYVEIKQCVTRTEIKKWWNGDVE